MPAFFLISLLFFSLSIYSQTVMFVEKGTLWAVSDVLVYNAAGQNAISDKKGSVSVSGFSQDSIMVQHFSFDPLIIAFPKTDTVILLIPKNVLIDEIVFTASRYNEKIKEVPFKVTVINEKHTQRPNITNSADMLEENGDILIQKTQGGGGSPILRGFEANKLLLVVDGIRMNNAIYRSGHLQNSLTIDHASIEKTEVVFGPNSLMYGSDAIGGVIHYRTINPVLQAESDSHNVAISGSTLIKHNLSFQSNIKHIHISAGKKKCAVLGSITHSEYGNSIMGKHRNKAYPDDFGLHKYYTLVSDSGDFVLNNTNPLEQLYTAYEQFDVLGKLLYSPVKNLRLISNFQYSESSNINRYDNLIVFSDNMPKYSEWYYGPQKRSLIAQHITIGKKTALYDNFNFSISHQKIEESRHSRQYGYSELLSQIESVDLFSASADCFLAIKGYNISYGAESNINHVASNAQYVNIHTGEQSLAQTRYPNKGSRTFDGAFYLSAKRTVAKNLIANIGGRYSFYSLHAGFEQTQFVNFPFKKVAFTNMAPSANVGIIYTPLQWQISVMASSGFRNPNVDDIGKVRAKSGQILVPSGSITPEFAYNIELSAKRNFGESHTVGIAAYNVWITHIITRVPYSLNNKDSLLYDGEYYELYTNTNTDLATVSGISAYAKGYIIPSISYMATINYTQGNNHSIKEPLGHIPPVFGKCSINWKQKNIETELYVKYNGWKYMNTMSTTGEDNETYATDAGFPAWATLHASIQYDIGIFASLFFSVDNIADTYYIPFASAVSGAGRNFSCGIKARF